MFLFPRVSEIVPGHKRSQASKTRSLGCRSPPNGCRRKRVATYNSRRCRSGSPRSRPPSAPKTPRCASLEPGRLEFLLARPRTSDAIPAMRPPADESDGNMMVGLHWQRNGEPASQDMPRQIAVLQQTIEPFVHVGRGDSHLLHGELTCFEAELLEHTLHHRMQTSRTDIFQ